MATVGANVDEAMSDKPATILEAYRQGSLDGLRAFAYWKDGVQYVGTGGTLLADAEKTAQEFTLWNQRMWAYEEDKRGGQVDETG